MAERTGIAWCDSTKGPWLVCTEISPGCANCYARELAESRLGPIIRKAYKAAGLEDWETRPVWGKNAPRVLTRQFHTGMLAFNRKPWVCDECGKARGTESEYQLASAKLACANCGPSKPHHRRRSFPSLIDWLDDMPAGILDQDGNWLDATVVFAGFLNTIRMTPDIIHILCTKRPELWYQRVAQAANATHGELNKWISEWLHGNPIPNVILLASVENQAMADKRIPELLSIPAVCHGLSCEPLLGPLDVRGYIGAGCSWGPSGKGPFVKWVIAGGESGPNARPCDVEWIRWLVEQGKQAEIATFVKQLGSMSVHTNMRFSGTSENLKIIPHSDGLNQLCFTDKKGGDMNEWPHCLRVQQFPTI